MGSEQGNLEMAQKKEIILCLKSREQNGELLLFRLSQIWCLLRYVRSTDKVLLRARNY